MCINYDETFIVSWNKCEEDIKLQKVDQTTFFIFKPLFVPIISLFPNLTRKSLFRANRAARCTFELIKYNAQRSPPFNAHKSGLKLQQLERDLKLVSTIVDRRAFLKLWKAAINGRTTPVWRQDQPPPDRDSGVDNNGDGTRWYNFSVHFKAQHRFVRSHVPADCVCGNANRGHSGGPSWTVRVCKIFCHHDDDNNANVKVVDLISSNRASIRVYPGPREEINLRLEGLYSWILILSRCVGRIGITQLGQWQSSGRALIVKKCWSF